MILWKDLLTSLNEFMSLALDRGQRWNVQAYLIPMENHMLVVLIAPVRLLDWTSFIHFIFDLLNLEHISSNNTIMNLSDCKVFGHATTAVLMHIANLCYIINNA